MPDVFVDGQLVKVEGGASVLDAVLRAEIQLPHLCKDPDRPALGTCRTCLVAIEGMRGTPAACSTPATDGMVVSTTDPRVRRIRDGVLQLTLDMIPMSGSQAAGQLATAAAAAGLTAGRFGRTSLPEIRAEVDASNAFWTLDRSRCILCKRCVDACQRVQHIGAIAMLGHGDMIHVGAFDERPISESICTSCGQCLAACPTGAIYLGHPESMSSPRPEPARGFTAPTVDRRVKTVCPYCGVGCGIELVVDSAGEIRAVDDVPENLSSQGMLCVKGRFGTGFVASPNRLTKPLIRDDRSLPFRAASWDEALDLVAERLVAHRGQVGVFGSAKATNEDSYVIQKLARVLLQTNNVDHCARLCHSPSMTAMMEMLGSGAMSNSYEDFEQAGCLMIAGSDTDANHPVIAARIRRAVAENGIPLIVVNPRSIHLCDIATLWLRPRPGTDIALFNGLSRIALDEGWWDSDFVESRTEGFEVWRGSLDDYAPDRVAAITGIPEEEIRHAARLFARPERGNSCLLWGMGITQHSSGTGNVEAMVDFALLTGQIGKPGSGLAPLRGQNNVQGCCDMGVLPDYLPGYQSPGPVASARFSAAWGGPLPIQTGLKLTEMIDAAFEGELRAIYLTGENPMLTEPNLGHVRAALERLEFLVVQTILPNESTEMAHVVLPAACFAEKDGTVTNSERRVQRVRKAVEPPGEARADWEISCDLARRIAIRIGMPVDGFSYSHPSEIWDEVAGLVPAYAGISYERIERQGIQWPCPTQDHPGTSLLGGERFNRGKALFVVAEQAEPAIELPDAAFPLLLNTGRVLYHWHGGDLTREVDGLLREYPRVEIDIHPDDAAEFGIRTGDATKVASRRGEIVAHAVVTDDVRRGEVFIPFVQLQGTAVNTLTNNVFDPRAKIPEYKVCAVRIAPV